MKVIDIIKRSLRLLGAIDANEPLEARSAEDALAVLNVLLAEWEAADIGQPYTSFASLQTTVTEVADADALAYQLALRIAPEYGIDVAPRIIEAASEAMSRLRLRYFEVGEVDFTELPSTVEYYNIYTG